MEKCNRHLLSQYRHTDCCRLSSLVYDVWCIRQWLLRLVREDSDQSSKKKWLDIETFQLKFHSNLYYQRAEGEEKIQNSIRELMQKNTMTTWVQPIHWSSNETDSLVYTPKSADYAKHHKFLHLWVTTFSITIHRSGMLS
jgi:hypothetical protein